jgi:membrane-bound ClpP family serine protease
MEPLVALGIGLLIAGFILVGIEMVVPGFGAPGISGIVCLLGGIILTAKNIEEGLTMTVIVVVILAVMMTIAMVFLKHVKSPIILDTEIKSTKGYISASDMEYLVGKEGLAVTDLRPAGKCDIEGVEFDVRTEGRYIMRGNKVIISRIHENMIMVKEIL